METTHIEIYNSETEIIVETCQSQTDTETPHALPCRRVSRAFGLHVVRRSDHMHGPCVHVSCEGS